jgi:AraC-like DNA-binding protein
LEVLYLRNSDQYGVKFHFDNQFTLCPEKFAGITLYQFGELYIESNMEILPHKQWCHEISYIISGQGIFQLDGVDYVVNEGDLFISPLNGTHSIKAAKDSTLRFTYIGFNFNEDSNMEDYSCLKDFYRPNMKEIQTKDTSGVIFPFFRSLEEFYRKHMGFHMMVESYIKQILILTRRSFSEKEIFTFQHDFTSASVGNTIYSVIRYIDDNIFDIHKVSEISNALNYNQSYISDLFKKKMGMTMQKYINGKRIEKALELLKYGKLSITQVANQLNYSSVQSFSRAFGCIMNISPTQYIKQYRSEPTANNEKTGLSQNKLTNLF